MSFPESNLKKQFHQKSEHGTAFSLRTEALKDLLHEQFPPEIWIVDQLIPDKSVTILSGSPGSFKTWLYMELAVKTAKGHEAFGHFDTKQTNVLVIDEESGRRRLQKRFKQLGANDDTLVHFTSRIGYKMSQQYVNAIIDKGNELDVGLIIFDSFTRFNSADENASGDMAQLMDYYRQLADAGFAVLILHHNRKEAATGPANPAQSMRGSSDILAAADCHIAVSRVGQSEYITLTQTKNRDIWEPVPFQLRFYENASEFEYAGASKSSTEKHRDHLDKLVTLVTTSPGHSKTQFIKQAKAEGIRLGEKKIGALLDELAGTGEVSVETGTKNSYLYYPLKA